MPPDHAVPATPVSALFTRRSRTDEPARSHHAARQCCPRLLLRETQENLRQGHPRLLRQLAHRPRRLHPDPVLRQPLAGLERSPGDPAPSGRAQVLHLRRDFLAAGRHLPGRPADRLGLCAVPGHRRGRPAVLRLRLPADRLHADFHVDGKLDRRRPQRPDQARQGTARRPQAAHQGQQARALAALFAMDRLHAGRLLHAGRRADQQRPHRQPRPLGDLLDILLRRLHLPVCRLHARAGVQVHVPLRPLPERDVRPGYADHHLRPGTRRNARGAQEGCRCQGGRPR